MEDVSRRGEDTQSNIFLASAMSAGVTSGHRLDVLKPTSPISHAGCEGKRSASQPRPNRKQRHGGRL